MRGCAWMKPMRSLHEGTRSKTSESIVFRIEDMATTCSFAWALTDLHAQQLQRPDHRQMVRNSKFVWR